MKPKQYMATYTIIVQLCDGADMGCDLYLKYKSILEEYISKFITPKIQSKLGDSREFLEEYVKQWKKYTIMVFSMRKMFDYLDRFYLRNAPVRCENLV